MEHNRIYYNIVYWLIWMGHLAINNCDQYGYSYTIYTYTMMDMNGWSSNSPLVAGTICMLDPVCICRTTRVELQELIQTCSEGVGPMGFQQVREPVPQSPLTALRVDTWSMALEWYLYLWILMFRRPGGFYSMESHLPNLDKIHVIHTDTFVGDFHDFTKISRWSKVVWILAYASFQVRKSTSCFWLGGGIEMVPPASLRSSTRDIGDIGKMTTAGPQSYTQVMQKWDGTSSSWNLNAQSCALVHYPLPGMLLYVETCEHSRVWDGQVKSVVTWFADVSLSLDFWALETMAKFINLRNDHHFGPFFCGSHDFGNPKLSQYLGYPP